MRFFVVQFQLILPVFLSSNSLAPGLSYDFPRISKTTIMNVGLCHGKYCKLNNPYF